MISDAAPPQCPHCGHLRNGHLPTPWGPTSCTDSTSGRPERARQAHDRRRTTRTGASRLPVSEAPVIDQLRALQKLPEVVMATWRAAQAEGATAELHEAKVREALDRLDPLGRNCFPPSTLALSAAGPADRAQARQARAVAADAGAWASRPRTRRPPEGRLVPGPESIVVTIKLPFGVRKRGGRKLVLAPDGAPMPPTSTARGSRSLPARSDGRRCWRLAGTRRSKEIAKAEKINPSYARTTVFETVPIDHSGTSPAARLIGGAPVRAAGHLR